MAQAKSDIVSAQQPPAVHRSHVGRRRTDHFDQTPHGRSARITGQRVASLDARRDRVGDGHLSVRGGQRRSE